MKKPANPPRYHSIEEYLSLQDTAKQKTLRLIIQLILDHFPQLESKISWNVPTIHLRGKYVVGICAYKHHLTFSVFSQQVIEDLKIRLQQFVIKKNCFQIPINWEMDAELIKDLVSARLVELH